jgi:hypothetical protein
LIIPAGRRETDPFPLLPFPAFPCGAAVSGDRSKRPTHDLCYPLSRPGNPGSLRAAQRLPLDQPETRRGPFRPAEAETSTNATRSRYSNHRTQLHLRPAPPVDPGVRSLDFLSIIVRPWPKARRRSSVLRPRLVSQTGTPAAASRCPVSAPCCARTRHYPDVKERWRAAASRLWPSEAGKTGFIRACSGLATVVGTGFRLGEEAGGY